MKGAEVKGAEVKGAEVRHHHLILMALLAGLVWFTPVAKGQAEDQGPPGMPTMLQWGPAEIVSPVRSLQSPLVQIDPHPSGIALIFELQDLPDCQAVRFTPVTVSRLDQDLDLRLVLLPAADCSRQAPGRLRVDLDGLAGGQYTVAIQVQVQIADRLETCVDLSTPRITVAAPAGPDEVPRVDLQLQRIGEPWQQVVQEASAGPGHPGRPDFIIFE